VRPEGYQIQKLIFETEASILMPGLLFGKDAEDRSPLVLYVHGEPPAAVKVKLAGEPRMGVMRPRTKKTHDNTR